MNFKESATLLVFLLFVMIHSNAQNGNYELRSVVPPSATVASLGKYGEIPVSPYTGIPNISIPLYEIKDGPLSVPISLSYHAGGIKVEEVAPAVGLGWALNAGGIVGRQQRGKPDETGWIAPAPNRIDNIIQNGTQGQINQMTLELEGGAMDGEADIYYYNFNGQSGKFFFDQAGTLHNYPAKNVAIGPLGGGSIGFGTGWQITTEDGTIYEFDRPELVTTLTCRGGDNDVYTAWYLTKIKSADGKRQITFTYESQNYSASIFLGQTQYFTLNGYGGCLNNDPAPCAGTNLFTTYRLKRIDFSEGYVKFNYSTADRLDLPNDKSLDQIEIYTKANTLVKKYDLLYSYFDTGGSTTDDKRLKLNSITEKSATDQKPPHVFTYEESVQLPNRQSLSTDHWGYFNGKPNSSHIASFKITNPVNGNPYVYYGADKNANPATAQAGILKKIQYPTGGETEFTYESNTTADPRIPPTTYDEYNYFSLNQSYTSLTSPYETATFTVPSQGANVQFFITGITASNNYCNYEVNLHCYLIKDNNISSPYTEITDATNTVRLDLPAGTYKFRFTFDGCYTGNLNFFFSLLSKIPILSDLGKRPVGGLRVKQIEDRPGGGGQSVVKKYRYESDVSSTQSSGVLFNYPEYGYVLDANRYEGGQSPGYPCYTAESCKYWVAQSKTNYPLASSQGSYVGYWRVIEDMGDNGEIWHRYNAYSLPNPPFPFAPMETSEWQRGVEQATSFYAKKNGQLVLSKEMGYGYLSVNLPMIKGYMIGRSYIVTGTCATMWANAPLTTYFIMPQFWALNFVNERVYDQNDPSKYVETTTNYTYDPNHLQPTQVLTSASSSDATVKDEIVVNKKYPQEYSFSGTPSGAEALGIKKLQDLHIVDRPIEEYTVKQKRNSSTNQLTEQRVTGSVIVSYKSDNPYADQIYKMETTSLVSLSSFGSGSTVSGNSFIKNSNSTIAGTFKPKLQFTAYDNIGNLASQQKADDVPRSYLWGYDNGYPVAEAINAKPNEIFFEGFEEAGTWNAPATRDASKAHTGLYSGRITNTSAGESVCHSTKTLGISLSAPTKYKYSGWVYSNGPSAEIFLFMKRNGETGYYSYVDAVLTSTTGKWVYVEKEFLVPADVTQLNIRIDNNGAGTVWFDDIRLHPSAAQMTTYTYNPLVGSTSASNANSRPVYYEYDSFGRLVIVRDQDGNVVKKICYNYAGQVENCSTAYFTNVAKSGSFTKNNCSSGTGGTVTYTVSAGAYSSTISQADADQKAQNDVNLNGQAYANGNAPCTWANIYTSGSFTRNNCTGGATGGLVTYVVPTGTYNSTTSQAAADALAQNDINTNGQAYANANGTCYWWNTAQSGSFTKNNCPSGYTGSTVTYTMPAGNYSSTISQADANQQALNAVNSYGQTYANTNGTCTGTGPQVTLYGNNWTSTDYSISFYNAAINQTYYMTLGAWGSQTLTLPVGTYSVGVGYTTTPYTTLINVGGTTTYDISAYFPSVYLGTYNNFVSIGD